jgi:hypothetical protein
VRDFMPAFEFVIEGEDPRPYLRQMEKSGAVRVLGPHIDSHYYPGSDFEGMRMAVKVSAASVTDARKLVEGYLPDLGFNVKPVIRKA